MSSPYLRRKGDQVSAFSNYFFLAFLVGVLYIFYLVIRPFLKDIFLAIMFAMVFYPVYHVLQKWFRGRRIPAALVTVLLIVVVFLVPFTFISGLVAGQSLDLYKTISEGLQDGSLKKTLNVKMIYFSNFLEKWHIDAGSLQLDEKLWAALKNLTEFMYIQMTSLAKGFLGMLFDFIIILFISFFLLIDGEKFLREIKTVSPLEKPHHERILDQAGRTIKATLKGPIIVAFVQGLLGGIGFWIFQIPSAAFWGSLMVFSSVIPLVGTSIIWVPAVLYLAFTSSFWMALGMALWGTLIVAGADNVLRPLLLRGEANLHPLFTFLSILGGLSYFGFLGFILGPVVLSFLMTLFEIYKRDFLPEPVKPV